MRLHNGNHSSATFWKPETILSVVIVVNEARRRIQRGVYIDFTPTTLAQHTALIAALERSVLITDAVTRIAKRSKKEEFRFVVNRRRRAVRVVGGAVAAKVDDHGAVQGCAAIFRARRDEQREDRCSDLAIKSDLRKMNDRSVFGSRWRPFQRCIIAMWISPRIAWRGGDDGGDDAD